MKVWNLSPFAAETLHPEIHVKQKSSGIIARKDAPFFNTTDLQTIAYEQSWHLLSICLL